VRFLRGAIRFVRPHNPSGENMPDFRKVLSIDSAAEKILAVLDDDAPHLAKKASKAGSGLAVRLARTLEIPPDLTAGAGDAAVGAMQAIKQAFDAGSGGLRQNYLVQAQRNIAALDPSRHGTLVRHLQARVLALQGRGGDTRIVHVTPGELVIPERLQTPEVLGALRVAAMHAGVDPDRLEVGSDRNAINPETGEMEFADQDGTPPPPPPPSYTDGDGNKIEGITVTTPPYEEPAPSVPQPPDPCAERPQLIAERDRIKQEIDNIDRGLLYGGATAGIAGRVGTAVGKIAGRVAVPVLGARFLLERKLEAIEQKLQELDGKCSQR